MRPNAYYAKEPICACVSKHTRYRVATALYLSMFVIVLVILLRVNVIVKRDKFYRSILKQNDNKIT